MKLIELKDLPDNFKVYLNDNFRKRLIKTAIENSGGLVKLSCSLKFDWSSLCKLRRGYRIINKRKSIYFIKIPLLKKLLEITNVSIKETERNIVGLATNKILIKTKLPINKTPELASIIGHAIGDGHVSSERFKYVNQREELVEEVRKDVNLVFGYYCKKKFIDEKKCYLIGYPAVIGKLLGMLGAPLGRKVIKNFLIPEWINYGSNKIKIEFLQTLFDDEGSVVKSNKQRFISISMYKQNDLVDIHKKFLNQIRELLISFQIKPQKICFKKSYKDTKEYGFRIGGYNNLFRFLQKIDFLHKLKHQRLEKIISHYYLKRNVEN